MYMEIGEGWQPLVETFSLLCSKDAQYGRSSEVEILQVKEKFGTLRIYYTGGNELTDAHCRFAEEMSARMCEECGAPASERSIKGWIKTLCEEHV